MRNVLVGAMLLALAGCADQAPDPSEVILPRQIGPSVEVLEVRAMVRDTRVPIRDSIVVDIHVRNPLSEPVEIVSACVDLMYLTAFRGEEETGLDGSGFCRTALSVHPFAPGEEKVITQRVWARRDDYYERGRYRLRVDTWAYEGIPELDAPFEVR